MIRHTATFSDGRTVERNFKKALPFAVQSVNTQVRVDGSILVQTYYGFSSVNKAKNLFGKMTGKTVNEVVPAHHS